MDVQIVPYPPPADAEDCKRITALAAYVAKNGTDIEKAVLQKEQNNPKFSFLSGGEYAGFYRWSIFVAKRNYTDEVINRLLAHHTERLQSTAAGYLDLLVEDRRVLENMLINNSGSKEGIKTIRCWITERSHSMAIIADIIAAHVRCLAQTRAPATSTKILHTIYLINDVFFNSAGLSQFGPYTQLIPQAQQLPVQPVYFFYFHLAAIFHHALTSADLQDKLLKLLHLWQTRAILSPFQVQEISTLMHQPPLVPPHPPVVPPFVINLPPPMIATIDPYTVSVGVLADVARAAYANAPPYSPLDASLLQQHTTSRKPNAEIVEDKIKKFYRAWDDMEYGSESCSDYSRDD